MHDPMTVAFDVCLPIPVRRWPSRNKRWHVGMARRNNEENLGELVYPFWHPAGVELHLAGWRMGLYKLGTMWHVDPTGDHGPACGTREQNRKWWRFHVHHWKLQVHPWQTVRRFLFDRCASCGLRFPFGYSPVSFSWEPKRNQWWAFWRSAHDLHHDYCSRLVSAHRDLHADGAIVRKLIAQARVMLDVSEAEFFERVKAGMEFGEWYRLKNHHLRLPEESEEPASR